MYLPSLSLKDYQYIYRKSIYGYEDYSKQQWLATH